MKHKHHDLIVQWAKDTSQKVWVCKEHDGGYWVETPAPRWIGDCTYKIQEDRPTEPPAKKVSFFDGGIEFDEPINVLLSHKCYNNGQHKIQVEITCSYLQGIWAAIEELINTRLKPQQDT